MGKRSKSLLGVLGMVVTPVLFVWGVPGMLDDLDTWSRWVGPNLTIALSFVPAVIGVVLVALANWRWLDRKVLHRSEDLERRKQVIADGRALEAHLSKYCWSAISDFDTLTGKKLRFALLMYCRTLPEYNRISRYLGSIEVEQKEGDVPLIYATLWIRELHERIDALEDRWNLSIKD